VLQKPDDIAKVKATLAAPLMEENS